jgi:hypothetical protein
VTVVVGGLGLPVVLTVVLTVVDDELGLVVVPGSGSPESPVSS